MSAFLKPLRVIGVAILLLLSAANAYSDGVYFPERAFRKLPEIPTQRAIISYKNGVETLIVESALKADGQNFGWIIPVPAEPVELKKAPIELLNVFSTNTQPEIIHERLKPLLIAFLAVTLFFLTYILFEVRLRDLIAISISLLFIYGIFGAKLGTKGVSSDRNTARIEGIDIRNHVDIGSYEVTVLKAAHTDDLNSWLETNDFSKIPSAGNSIVNDYIRQNWVFVAAKLKRKEGGLSVPHPLLLKFTASKPVYPMRLTALAGAELYLQLFVIGEQKAAFAPALGKGRIDKPIEEFADRYGPLDKKTAKKYHVYDTANDQINDGYPIFMGEGFHEIISHPFAREILWPGCVVTSFAGRIAPENMTEDYKMDFSTFGKFRKKYYSNSGAIAKAFSYALVLWVLALVIASIYAKTGRPHVITRIVLPAMCVFILVCFLSYKMLPVVKVKTVRGGPLALPQYVAQGDISVLKRGLDNYKEDTGSYPTTSQGLDALVSDPEVKGWNGPYLGNSKQAVIPKDPWNNPYHYRSPGLHSRDIRSPLYLYKYGGYDLNVHPEHSLRIYRSSDEDPFEIQLRNIEKALDKFKEDTGEYPTTAQGLKALISNPGLRGWNGPYIEGKLLDGLSKPYHYKSPGDVKQRRGQEDYDLFSYGEDNEPGGAGLSEDITSWN